MGTERSRALAEAQALNSEADFGTRSGPSNRALMGVSLVWSVRFVVQKNSSGQGLSRRLIDLIEDAAVLEVDLLGLGPTAGDFIDRKQLD